MLWSESVNKQLHSISQLGMQQAADTFSQLIRQPVVIEVTEIWMSDQESSRDLPHANGIGIYMGISGEFAGGLLLFLADNCASWLAGKLLRRSTIDDLFKEPASSTLKEIGNIISSAFLASLDDQLGLRSLPSPPVMSRGTVSSLVDNCQHGVSEPCLVVRTHLRGDDQEPAELQGESYLFLSCRAMEQLVSRIKSP